MVTNFKNTILLNIFVSCFVLTSIGGNNTTCFEQQVTNLIKKSEIQIYSNQDSAIKSLNLAYKIIYDQKIDNFKPQIDKKYGDFYKTIGNYTSAANYYLKALRGFEKIKDTTNIAFTLISIGDLYRASGALETALNFLNEAYKQVIHVPNIRCLAKLQSRLSATCYEIFYNNDSIFNFKNFQNKLPILYPDTSKKSWLEISYLFSTTAYQNALRIKDTTLILENLNLIGAYHKANQNNKIAIKYFNYAIDLCKKANVFGEEALYLFNIAGCYQQAGDLETAIKIAELSFKKASQCKIKTYQWLASELLYKIYLTKQNLTTSNYYHSIRDSIIHLTINDSSLKTLQKQEKVFLPTKEISQSTVKNQNSTIWFIILISFGIIFLIVFFKIKRRNRQ